MLEALNTSSSAPAKAAIIAPTIITPEIAKKFINNGFEINIQKNYASHLGFEDKDYEDVNVKILDNEKLVLEKSDILAQLNLPSKSLLESLNQNKTLIGVLNPYQNKENLEELVKKKINCFSLELLPRITRAQSHDFQLWNLSS